MKKVLALTQKELKTTWASLGSFLPLVVFSLLTGFFFFANAHDYHSFSLQAIHAQSAPALHFTGVVISPFFQNMGLCLFLIVPILTSRAFIEEKNTGTLELLWSYPISDFQIVLGKFLGIAAQLAVFLLPTFAYFLLLYGFQRYSEIAFLWIPFLGVYLMALFFSGITLFISAAMENQIACTIISYAVFILLWLMGWAGDWMGASLATWLKELWPVMHLREFSLAILDTNTLFFYLVGIAFFFFLTVLQVEKRARQ